MKKLLIINLIFGFICLAVPFAVKADDKTTATVSHVISETIKGTDIDHTALLEAEMSKIAHQFAIQMTFVMQKHLPQILEGLAADIRLKADKEYKCKLLEGGTYECNQ